MLDMTKLGFEQDSLDRFQRAIAKPYGIVLVTGPTGSGKTNTLYSAIAQLNKPDTNIMTAEDPVEFNLPGINQIQIKDQIGLNFASALRSFLRQDPEHHPGRRDPRLRDGRDRGQGRADGPPGALDAAHERRAVHHLAPRQHGHRAVPGGHRLQPDPGPAPHPQGLHQLPRGGARRPGEDLVEIGFPPRRPTPSRSEGRGCGVCNGTGYKGASGSTRSWRSRRASATSSWSAPPRSRSSARRWRRGC
jgi:type IV pilus assembly protein PilB